MSIVTLSRWHASDVMDVEVELVLKHEREDGPISPPALNRWRPGDRIGHEFHLRFTVRTSSHHTRVDGQWLIFTGVLLVDFRRHQDEASVPVEELQFVVVEDSPLAEQLVASRQDWPFVDGANEPWAVRHFRVGFRDLGRFDIVCLDVTRCQWPRPSYPQPVLVRAATGEQSQQAADWSSVVGLMTNVAAENLLPFLSDRGGVALRDPDTGQTLLQSAIESASRVLDEGHLRSLGIDPRVIRTSRDERMVELLGVLLDAGADPHERGKDGESAYDTAVRLGHSTAVRLFEAHRT